MRPASSSSVSPSGAPGSYARGLRSPSAFTLRSSPPLSSRNRTCLLSLERCCSSWEVFSSHWMCSGDLLPGGADDLPNRVLHQSRRRQGERLDTATSSPL